MADHNDGFVDICVVKNHLWAVRRDGVILLDDGNKVGWSVPIDRICVGLRCIVGESNGSLFTLEHQRRVLLSNMGTCAVTGNSTCPSPSKAKSAKRWT